MTTETPVGIHLDRSPENIARIGLLSRREFTPEDLLVVHAELEACQNFVYFLTHYAMVLVPPQPGQAGMETIRPFELKPHMAKAVDALLHQKLIVWMKSRQIWASTLMSIYDYWYARFHKGAKVMVMSKGKDEAAEKIHKCKTVHNALPPWMKLPIDPDSTTEIGIPDMLSSIKAFPATETAGISYTASVVDSDEWAEHPYADANYLSLKPCRDAGGQFIGVFTPSMTGDTLAEDIFKAAIAYPHHRTVERNGVQIVVNDSNRNGYFALFDGCFVVPGRDQAWYDLQKKNVPLRELSFLTPDLFMAKAYPRSIEEALMPLSTIMAFDHKVLDAMVGDALRTVPVDGLDPLTTHVYKPHTFGSTYVAATDTSHGVGKDFSVSVIMNAKTGEVVADIVSNLLTPQELAHQTVKLLVVYQNPVWYIETNDWGAVTVNVAQDLGYPNLGYHDEKRNRVGVNTNESTRREIWGELIAGVNTRQITIYNPDGVKQFYDVIRNAQKGGRIEGKLGAHDDYPMAVGIAWFKRATVAPTVSSSGPIQTLHFGGRGSRLVEPGRLFS